MSKTEITAEPGIPMIVITREFDAPRELVFRAHTDPDLVVQWLGPRDLTTAIERYEVRNGGAWRYVQTDAEGSTYGFRGVFHGDPSPDAIVQTFEFEGAPRSRLPAERRLRRAGRQDAGADGRVLPSRWRTATRWSPPAWSAASTTPASGWPSCLPGCRRTDPRCKVRSSVADSCQGQNGAA